MENSIKIKGSKNLILDKDGAEKLNTFIHKLVQLGCTISIEGININLSE